jgi:hypothetical protein
MSKQGAALAVAIEILGPELAGSKSEVYVTDKGPAFGREYPRTRYEAGIRTGCGGIGFRTGCVYGSSWGDLIENLHRRPEVRRRSYASAWTAAAYLALVQGVEPAIVAAASQQLEAWIVNGSEED